jgi:hypothetical protein
MRRSWEQRHPERTAEHVQWMQHPDSEAPGIADPMPGTSEEPDRPPPSAGPPASAPRPRARFEPLRGRLRLVLIVLALIAAADVAAVVSDLLELHLFDRVEAGEQITETEATNNDDRQGAVGIVQLLLLVVGAIVWIRWFHRAYCNLGAIRGVRRFGTGWAIGSWFVPLLGLWRPKQIANDIARVVYRGREPWWLTAWWLVWIMVTFVTNAAGRNALGSAGTLDELRTSTTLYLVSDFGDIVAAGLAALVAVRLTRGLEERAAPVAPDAHSPIGSTPERPETAQPAD